MPEKENYSDPRQAANVERINQRPGANLGRSAHQLGVEFDAYKTATDKRIAYLEGKVASLQAKPAVAPVAVQK